MKRWEKALGNIRFLGLDTESFREDVKLVSDYIAKLEVLANHLRRADHVFRELDNHSKHLSDHRLDELHAQALMILRQAHEQLKVVDDH